VSWFLDRNDTDDVQDLQIFLKLFFSRYRADSLCFFLLTRLVVAGNDDVKDN